MIFNESFSDSSKEVIAYMSENKNNFNSNLNKSTIYVTTITFTFVNAAIMSASISGAIKLAQKAPTIAGKIATIGAGVGLVVGAIASKKIIGNIIENIGKKEYLPTMIDLSEIFGLTGNSLIDLIIMIKYFQKIQFLLLEFISYYLIIYIIDLSKLESYLIKIFPTKFVSYIIKFFYKIKKIGLITIIILILLCLIASYLNGTYLDFLFENLDEIIKLYNKNL